MEDATELHLRPRAGGQSEDEAVLIHLRAAQIRVKLRVGQRRDRWGVVERQFNLAGDLNQAHRRHEQLAGRQLARLIIADRLEEPRWPPVLDALVSTRQGADDLFAGSGERDVGEAALFGQVQLGRRQFFLQQLVRQHQPFASPVRGESSLDQMRDDHQPELKTFGLVHSHQVDRVHGLIQGGNLLISLRRLRGVEMLEVRRQMLVRVLVAIGSNQFGQLLDVGADLQRFDRPGKAGKVQIAGLLHDVVEEIVDGKPQCLAGEAPQIRGQPAGSIVVGFFQEVEEPPAFIPRPARPAARLDGIDGVAWQAEQPHQAHRVVGAVRRP